MNTTRPLMNLRTQCQLTTPASWQSLVIASALIFTLLNCGNVMSGEKLVLPKTPASPTELNPIPIPEIGAEIRYGDKAGTYWWGGKKKDGKGFELKHSLEIKLQSGTYVIRPEFSKDYNAVSASIAENEVYLNDHLSGFNYGYNKGLLVLQGATGGSHPSIQWLVIRLTQDGKRLASMEVNVPECMGIPALWEPGEVENWYLDLGYPQYRTIPITNKNDRGYGIKAYRGSVLRPVTNDWKITDFPFEFYEISKSDVIRVDNNPVLYRPYFDEAKIQGNTWKTFYYGVRAGVVSTDEYEKYGISYENAKQFEKDTHRRCKSYKLRLHKVRQ